jgi:hypothetical protein
MSHTQDRSQSSVSTGVETGVATQAVKQEGVEMA